MAKSFEDLMKKTCSKDVIIAGYKKAMNYWAEYIGLNEAQQTTGTISTTKIFRPYTITTKTVSHYSKPKRRDPARHWK
jgi:hypothetical protein